MLLKGPDGDEIRDYKTSDEVIGQEEAAMQIRIYAYGLQIRGGKVSSGSVAYIEDARVEKIMVTVGDVFKVRR